MTNSQIILEIMRAFYRRRDWDKVSQQAQILGWETIISNSFDVAPFIYHSLLSSPDILGTIPENGLKKLKQSCAQAIHKVTILEKECRRIVTCLQAAGVSPVVLKGLAYQSELYQQYLPKNSNDIDLLVRQDEFKRIHAYLLQMGFELYPYPQDAYASKARYEGRNPLEYGGSECHYLRKTATFTIQLDMHVEIVIRNPAEKLPVGSWFREAALPWHENTEEVTVGEYKFRRLCLEMHFLHLVLHFAHHSFAGMKWFLEICRFIEVFGKEIDWNYYDRLELSRHCRRLMGIVLRMVCEVTGGTQAGADKWPIFWTSTSEREFRFFQSCLERDSISQFRRYLVLVLLGADWKEKSFFLSYLLFDGQAIIRFRNNGLYQRLAPFIQPLYLLGRVGLSSFTKIKSSGGNKHG